MGVHFSANGLDIDLKISYGYFNKVRVTLAHLAGIELNKMRGFTGRWEGGENTDPREWEPFAAEPLVPFLNCVDCEGEWTAEECRTISKRIEELLPKWPPLEVFVGLNQPRDDHESCYFCVWFTVKLQLVMQECAERGVALRRW